MGVIGFTGFSSALCADGKSGVYVGAGAIVEAVPVEYNNSGMGLNLKVGTRGRS